MGKQESLPQFYSSDSFVRSKRCQFNVKTMMQLKASSAWPVVLLVIEMIFTRIWIVSSSSVRTQGHSLYCQQRELSKFHSLHWLTVRSRDWLSRWRHSRRRLTVCSVLRCAHLWLQRSERFLHTTQTVQETDAADLHTSKRSTQKAFSCCDAILGSGPAAPQWAWESWTGAAADGACCPV
jgi:hypothetical protein